MAERRVEYQPVDSLVPALRNAKGHHAESIAASVGRFGLIDVIAVDERTGRIVSGHGRHEELLRAFRAGDPPPDGVQVVDGRWMIPVVRGWASADDDEAQAAGIAVNRTTELGGWVQSDLAADLSRLGEVGDDLLAVTGFDRDDLVKLIADLDAASEPPAPPSDPDDVPEPPRDPATKRGDLWLMGDHRLLCGDCRNAEDVARLVDGRTVNVAFTSPPYADRRVYDESSEFRPVPPDEYVEWFAPVAANVAEVLADDGSWFVNIKPGADGLDTELYVVDLVIAHVREWGWHFATEFCWERSGVPKQVIRRFKNQFEAVYQFARGEWKIRPAQVTHASDDMVIPFGPGAGETNWANRQGNRAFFRPEQVRPRKGGTRGLMSDVQGTNAAPGAALTSGWAYPGNRLPTFSGTHEATGHTAAFPVGLPGFFIKAFSDEGDVVFDPFMGSGSTLIAAHQERRVGLGCEISARYCDVVLARWQRLTGEKPILESTGEPVDFSAEP